MPKVEIIGPGVEAGQPTLTWGTRILLDGVELTPTRSIAVDIPLDGLLTVKAEVIVTEQFSLVAAADLHINAVVNPGFVLVAEKGPHGTVRYRAELERRQ